MEKELLDKDNNNENQMNCDQKFDELLKKAIAYTVKEKRKNMKPYMTQSKLAEKADVNINSIVKIENARMCPTLATIFRISKALDYQSESEICRYIEEKFIKFKEMSKFNEYNELHENDLKKYEIPSRKNNVE